MSKTSTRTDRSAPGNGEPPLPAMPPSYEAALDELNALIADLESGDMPLDQLLSGYQRGAALLQFCKDRLQAVEEQVKVLDDGVLKAWKQP